MLRFRKKKDKKKDKEREESSSPQSSPREGSEEKTILDPPRKPSRENGPTFFVDTPLQATQAARRRSESCQSLALWKAPIINKYCPRTIRLLHLKRLPTGDFGFTLRKGYILDRIDGVGTVSPVIFAEPGVGNRQYLTSLLPGDRLMEVNGTKVEHFLREEIIELIRGTGNELSLGVQAIPELCEVNAASGSSENMMVRFNSTEPGESSTDPDSMWMRTDDGYTVAKVLGPLPNHDGIFEVMTENGQKVQVKERHLERANPEALNFTHNLGSLRFVNESSFLHTLRCRYANNLIHTYAGPTLLIMNPIYPLAIYSEKVSNAIHNTKVDLLPPHIYSLARKVYDDLILWKRNQSVVFLGHSGSGKTTNVRHLMNYMVNNSHGKFITPEKLHIVFTILDYMIYSRSASSCQSNRSTQVFCLDFDQSGRLCSMSLQLTILGRQCSFRRSPDEQPVDLVSQMVTGLDANQKSDLFLTGTNSVQKIIEHNKASQTWPKFAASLKIIGFSDTDVKAMCYVTAALIHLSNIRLHENQGKEKYLTLDPARRAATLLGLDLEDLARYIFDRDDAQNEGGDNKSVLSPAQLLEHFINCVYSEVVNVVVGGINRYLSSDDRIANSVLIFDSPGFKTNSGQVSTLNDLFDNYVQERLQDHYVQSTLASIVQKYDEDSLSYDYEFEERSSVAELIHASPQLSLTPKGALKKKTELNRKGLFWLMEEESMLDQGSDASFVHKLDSVGSGLIRAAHDGRFTVNHFSGSCKVMYDSYGWLSDCKINRGSRNIIGLLQSSNQDFILKFLRGAHRGARFSGLSLGGTSSLRRTTSMKFGTAGGNISQKALMFQLRSQTDKIIESLSKTHQNFVHCIAPTPNCGVIDGDAELKYSLMTDDKSLVCKEVMPDIPLLRSQIRSFRLLDVVGFWKRFHPESIRFGDFNRRYGLLAPPDPTLNGDNGRVRNLLEYLAIDASTYNMGKSFIFLRKDVLDKLESCRRNKVASNIVSFQAYCRGFVVRKKMQNYRSHRLAMGIIQKNVRKYMQLREWPWWRLFLKVKPLVTVNRMELELQGKDISLSEVMDKVRKIEDERNEFKIASRDNEQKLNNVLRELTEEQACVAEVNAELELERNRRLQYEKDLEGLTLKVNQLSSKNEQLEMDLMQSKVWRSEIENSVQEDSTDANLLEKYEAAVQELQFVKKQFKTDLMEEMEKERKKRKHVEGKLTTAVNDLQKEKESVASMKEKNSRISNELHDIKIYSDEQKAKLQDLARKQDGLGPGGIHELTDKVSKLKIEKQTLLTEQQNLVSENFTIKQELQELQYENDRLSAENRRLQDEIHELTESKGDAGDDRIRREYHSLKMKSADQEDELNELSDQVKLLEGSKNRLEMQIEALRRDHAKEMEEREEEFSEMKLQLQRRYRETEQQLEEEYETKRSLYREKTDLESQLRQALEDRQIVVSDGRMKKLQKDLKRTKALLQDAQAVLDRQRDESASKSQVRQLKNALDDAEFQANSSAKSLKTAQQELEECREDLNRVTKAKTEFEDKCVKLGRQNGDLQSRVEDLEDELQEIMKKYRTAVDQQTSRNLVTDELHEQISALQQENQTLKEDIATLTSKLEFLDVSTVQAEEHNRITTKMKDIETSLDLEKTMRSRLENNVLRLKENVQQLQEDNDDLVSKERSLTDELKRAQRRITELQEELDDAMRRESDSMIKCHALENKVSMFEDDLAKTTSELKLANRRVNDLRGQLEDIASDSYDYLDDSDDFSEAGSYASSEFGL